MEQRLRRCFEETEGDAVGIDHAEYWKPGGKASGLNGGATAKICQKLQAALIKSSNLNSDI